MAKLQSLAVECDHFDCRPGKPPELSYHHFAARDAARTRSRSAHHKTRMPDGRKIGLVCLDLLEDSRGVRLLQNWDDRTGQSVADSDGVRAELLPGGPRRHPWLCDPDTLLLQKVQTVGLDVLEVGAYLRANGSAKVLPAVEERGRRLVPVAVNHPKFGQAAPSVGIKSTLYFAPDAGGLILKQVHDIPAGSGFTVPVRMESTVEQLQTLPGGLVLPRTIRQTVTGTKPGAPTYFENLLRVSALQVNEQVNDEMFAFHFPEGILVRNYTQAGEVLVHRWGPDDKPVETWVDQPPAWAFTLARVLFGMNTSTLSVTALAFALACGTASYLIRRQRRRQQTAVTS